MTNPAMMVPMYFKLTTRVIKQILTLNAQFLGRIRISKNEIVLKMFLDNNFHLLFCVWAENTDSQNEVAFISIILPVAFALMTMLAMTVYCLRRTHTKAMQVTRSVADLLNFSDLNQVELFIDPHRVFKILLLRIVARWFHCVIFHVPSKYFQNIPKKSIYCSWNRLFLYQTNFYIFFTTWCRTCTCDN